MDSATHAQVTEVRLMLREMTVTTSSLHAQADAALSKVGQNLSRWQMLSQFAMEPTTVPNVARAMNVSRQYVQRMADEMVDTGHIVASPNPGHRRSPLFSATTEGAALLLELERSVSDWTSHLADSMELDEVAVLRRTLRHLQLISNTYQAPN